MSQIDADPGLPLGAVPGSGYTVTDIQLDPGTSVLFYSDGLVEHRQRSVSDGIAELERAVSDAPSNLAGLCAYVLDRLTGGSNDDDVALLAVTRTTDTDD